MNVNAQMNDKYEFLITLDKEAVEVIHKMGLSTGIISTKLVEGIFLGGLLAFIATLEKITKSDT